MVIATLLSTLSRDSTITIFSDSQAAIHAIENFTTTKSKSKLKKYKNWIIIDYITETINNLYITINLEKVKAYTGILGNEQADQLAHIGEPDGMIPGTKIISLNSNNIHTTRIKPKWENTTIDMPLPAFTKT